MYADRIEAEVGGNKIDSGESACKRLGTKCLTKLKAVIEEIRLKQEVKYT